MCQSAVEKRALRQRIVQAVEERYQIAGFGIEFGRAGAERLPESGEFSGQRLAFRRQRYRTSSRILAVGETVDEALGLQRTPRLAYRDMG